jgi:hypothetical protein
VLIVFALLLFGRGFPAWGFLPGVPLLLAALLGASVASVKIQVVRFTIAASYDGFPSPRMS